MFKIFRKYREFQGIPQRITNLEEGLKQILKGQGDARKGIEAIENRLQNRYERDAEAVMRAPIEAGQISFQESRALYETVKELEAPGPIMEIGTLFGSSTRIIALAKSPERPLISVDVYRWNPLGLRPDSHFGLTGFLLGELVESFGLELIRRDKDEFYKEYAGPAPSLVFLDADHSYEATLKDIRWAKSVGTKVICGHDYDEVAFPGVCRAVEDEGGAAKVVGSFWILSSQVQD